MLRILKQDHNLTIAQQRYVFTDTDRFQIDLCNSIMVTLNAICQDRLLKLASMIKASPDAEAQKRYCIKRNYYQFQAKPLVDLILRTSRSYDRSLNRLVSTNADINGNTVSDAQLHTCDMLDFSDEYLKNDYLNLRSWIRHHICDSYAVKPQDPTMITRLYELIVLTELNCQAFAHFSSLVPKLDDCLSFTFLNGTCFNNVARKAFRTVDVRDVNGARLSCAKAGFFSDDLAEQVSIILHKVMSVDFIKKLMAARDGVPNEALDNMDFTNLFDCKQFPMPKEPVQVDNTIQLPEPLNKQIV